LEGLRILELERGIISLGHPVEEQSLVDQKGEYTFKEFPVKRLHGYRDEGLHFLWKNK
jgi:hypothetical protein